MKERNILSYVCICILFCSCLEKPKNTLNCGLLKGPSSIGMVKALEDLTFFESKLIQYQSKDNPQQLRALVQSGNIDMAILPLTMAYTMISNSIDIKIAAITGWGNLYIISRDSIAEFKTLSGHTISIPGEAQTPDLITKFFINYYNLNEKININYTYPAPILLTSALAVGKVNTAILPEPLASIALMKDTSLIRSLSLGHLWEDEIQRPLIQSVLVINNTVYQANKSWFKAYFKQISNQVKNINNNPQEALMLAHRHQLLPVQIQDTSIIKNSRLDFLYGKKIAGPLTSYLKTFYPETNEEILSTMLIE